jgi:transcriptional regulator with XRE-family HTH domain
MRREHYVARVLRAVSGKSQEQLGKEVGIQPARIARFELGQALPSPEQLRRLASGSGISVEDAEEILRRVDTLRQPKPARSPIPDDLFDRFTQRLRADLQSAYERILELPRPDEIPCAEDRQRAAELWERLVNLPEEIRFDLVEVSEEYQDWALCERACAEAANAAAHDLEKATSHARLAREIAARISGPPAWRNRVLAYAMLHQANILRVSGEPGEAEEAAARARELWRKSADPDRLLGPVDLLGLEAS